MYMRERKTTDKIRILHMTPLDINNGVYRYIFNHMKYMDREKFEFGFLTRGAKELRHTEEYRRYGFKVYEFRSTQRNDTDGLRNELLKVFDRGFDVIHLHTSSWRGFLIEQTAMETGVKKVIVHSHSTGIDVADRAERDKQTKEHNRYKKLFSMRYATDVCACSRLAADWLFGPQIPRNQIQILPNAIDVGKYRFNLQKRKQIRDFLNLDNKTVIGSVGRYGYQKNQEFLIRAFAKAYGQNNSLFLLCMGEGEYLKKLRTIMKQLNVENSILCLEWQEHVEDYLQGMDVFCLPSRFEGLPISAVEAQASGLKCLVSDRVTKEVGITGLVKFLPLVEDIWAEELAVCRVDGGRMAQDERIKTARYDIGSAVKQLEMIYKI